MAHLWLESEVMAGSSSTSKYSVKSSATNNPIEKELGKFFLQQITNDNSPIYGKGFQAGYASMMRFGLPRTLNHIKMTGSFPL
ncbi:hypothetical protein KP509_11G042600 [Ceratopteris richardii]|nr:hypothetical protein KP509_11G042600 [Ceratopteris richardii]